MKHFPQSFFNWTSLAFSTISKLQAVELKQDAAIVATFDEKTASENRLFRKIYYPFQRSRLFFRPLRLNIYHKSVKGKFLSFQNFGITPTTPLL